MQPTFFINHGGGPCFFLEPGPMRAAWHDFEACLHGLVDRLAEPPRAILAVRGHWEEQAPTVNARAHPPLLFDHNGFPDYTYQLTWPAPGDPALAAGVRDLLSAAGIRSGSKPARGWDHGVFVPLKIMYSAADVPLVQLSLQRGLDPAVHLAIGRALKPLREDGVLIRWEDASGARDAQPHEDHLRPLMVAAGAAAGEPGAVHFHSHVLGKPISGFRFG